MYRDRILLQGPAGPQRREPGGAENVYVVAPGGSHMVNVRFELVHLDQWGRRFPDPPGTRVSVDLSDAVHVGDRAVALPPIECVVQ